MHSDQDWMRVALSLAETAAYLGEVPVGAVIVKDSHVISTGFNLRERRRNALCHAELDAIRRACQVLNTWRLTGCELFVTLEPCIMCAGAVHQARLSRVIFAASDPKAGAMGSLYEVHADARLNHRVPVVSQVLADESSKLLQDFFRRRRAPSS